MWASSMGALRGAESVLRAVLLFRGSVKKKRLPWPGWLSSCSWPPISVTSRAEMARPSPVPPNLRVVDASACVNASNTRACCSGEMPMPVSATSNLTPTPLTGSALTRMCPPAGVNFTALDSRLVSTWRSRPGSPWVRVGRPGCRLISSWSCLALAWASRGAQAFSVSSAASNAVASTVILPASILDRSRMSLSKPSKVWADSSMSCSQWLCSVSRGESISRRISPITPLSGVRTSWLTFARKSVLARLADSACVRAVSVACSRRLRSRMSAQTPIRRKARPRWSCSVTMPWLSSQSHSSSSVRMRNCTS